MAHENLAREQEFKGSSDRSFGLVFSAAFIIIALWPLFDGAPLRGWAVTIAAVFAVVAMVRPSLLSWLNLQWGKLGLLLGKVTAPIVLGIMFFGVFTPIGAIMRLTGKDPLRLKVDRTTKSYWVPRDPPGPPPTSMKNQF